MKKDYIYSNAKLHYMVVAGKSDTPLVLIHGQRMCGHIAAETRLIGRYQWDKLRK